MSVRRKNELNLKEAIDLFINAYGLSPRLKEIRAITEWEKVVGENIAKLTADVHIKNHILFVKCKSAALRQELFYHKHEIIEKLNTIAEEKIINDMVIND